MASALKTQWAYLEGATIQVDGTRKDHPNLAVMCYGVLEGHVLVVGYTPFGALRPVISLRKTNDRVKSRLASDSGL